MGSSLSATGAREVSDYNRRLLTVSQLRDGQGELAELGDWELEGLCVWPAL